MKASVVTVWEAESASRARGEGRRDPGEDKSEGERRDSKKARMHEPGMGYDGGGRLYQRQYSLSEN